MPLQDEVQAGTRVEFGIRDPSEVPRTAWDRPPRSATRREGISSWRAPPFIRARPDPQGSPPEVPSTFDGNSRVRGGRCDPVRRSPATTDYPPSRYRVSPESIRWLRLSLWPCVLVAGVATVAMTCLVRQQSRCCRCVAGPRRPCRSDVRRERSLRLGQAIRESARCADDGGRLYLSWLARPDPGAFVIPVHGGDLAQ